MEKVRETSKPRDGVEASEDLGTDVGERGCSGRELVTERQMGEVWVQSRLVQ